MLCAPLRAGARPPFSSSRRTVSSARAHWPGLQSWRDALPNDGRAWGPEGPRHISSPPLSSSLLPSSSLAEWGARVLSTPDPFHKASLTHDAFSSWCVGHLPVGLATPPSRPARPPLPVLVTPKEVPGVKDSGMPLNAYLLHGLAHVELNAIDLAWDTVVRFSPLREELGEGFFADFARVADDESRHFLWCSQRLVELGFSYGDMPAHNLLWRECEKSSGDVAARLAVIPLVQEARGLDAGPRHVQRLVGFGDLVSSRIVDKIAEEEVAHVAVGMFWFLRICQKMGRIPCNTFIELLRKYDVDPKGPFNYSAREEAGIPREWYDGSVKENHVLLEVHKRLEFVISMESQNASLDT